MILKLQIKLKVALEKRKTKHQANKKGKWSTLPFDRYQLCGCSDNVLFITCDQNMMTLRYDKQHTIQFVLEIRYNYLDTPPPSPDDLLSFCLFPPQDVTKPPYRTCPSKLSILFLFALLRVNCITLQRGRLLNPHRISQLDDIPFSSLSKSSSLS